MNIIISNFYTSNRGIEDLCLRDNMFIYTGCGVEMGFGFNLEEPILDKQRLEFEIKGSIDPETFWSRLNVQYFSDINSTLFDGEVSNVINFFDINNNWQKVHVNFNHNVKIIQKLQFCFIGDNNIDIQIRCLRLGPSYGD